jgi:fermentation-respiration switch protein FrsA (DUF1100 family)
LKQVVLIGVIAFVINTLLMYLFQRHYMYYPSPDTPQLSHYQAEDMRAVALYTQDGLVLQSWYKPAKGTQPTIIYLHGNAGNIGTRMPFVRQFLNKGLGVLLLEYRGYGGNKGKPTEQGLYHDGRAGMRFLHQQGIKPEQIVIYGESLGSGVATLLAVEYKICALILQSPYTSFIDLARYHYPWVLMTPWDRFDSIKRIPMSVAPLLILHGQNDAIVPPSQGLALFEQARKPKKMLHFESIGHNNLQSVPNIADRIIVFIEQYCGETIK